MPKKKKTDPFDDRALFHNWITQECEYEAWYEAKSKDGQIFHAIFSDGDKAEVIASGEGPSRAWLHRTTFERVYPDYVRASRMGQAH